MWRVPKKSLRSRHQKEMNNQEATTPSEKKLWVSFNLKIDQKLNCLYLPSNTRSLSKLFFRSNLHRMNKNNSFSISFNENILLVLFEILMFCLFSCFVFLYRANFCLSSGYLRCHLPEYPYVATVGENISNIDQLVQCGSGQDLHSDSISGSACRNWTQFESDWLSTSKCQHDCSKSRYDICTSSSSSSSLPV